MGVLNHVTGTLRGSGHSSGPLLSLDYTCVSVDIAAEELIRVFTPTFLIGFPAETSNIILLFKVENGDGKGPTE